MNFTVAFNDRHRNPQTGEWEDRANYVDATIFGNRAEKLQAYLLKGTKVSIGGKLRWSSWDDKETGKKRSKVGIVVDELEFLSRRDGQPSEYQQSSSQQQTYTAPQQQAPAYTAPQQDTYGGYQPQVWYQQPQTEVYDTEDIPF